MAGEVPGHAVLQHGNLGGSGRKLGDLGLEQRLLLDALGLYGGNQTACQNKGRGNSCGWNLDVRRAQEEGVR